MRLYLKRYSKDNKNDDEAFDHPYLTNALGFGAGGLGMGAVQGSYISKNQKLYKRFQDLTNKTHKDAEVGKEDKDLLRKIKDEIRNNNINLKDYEFSGYVSKKRMKELNKGADPHVLDRSLKEVFGDKDHAILADKNATAGELAHELGHYKINRGKAGKISQFLQDHDELFKSKTGANLRSLGYGAATSATGFKVDDEGDVKFRKASLIAPVAGLLIPKAVPHYEHMATKKGLETLKKLGASEAYMKKSNDVLQSALNTYKSQSNHYAAQNLLNSGLGYGVSYINAKGKSSQKKKDKEGK